ncbi:hypothetical protein N4G70_00765 [Streptomyces sp. ASQP_92]|uniref:hypothetical protein n=1 Tax=Streptomyces sp. ASQP_92 TaxID=2979116 RepID=UPI0021C121F9|nr:hypothetical protein [Streptomyces sp. ASQP_92]MCT9087395.1 hypothetical protein [Streptomyces sp. ASQP_92]
MVVTQGTESDMTLPSWQDTKLGGKIRAALWLETEVGVGNTFTKAELRKAFPEVAQIDRRLRDLRDFGWRIDTSRDDPALKQEEQRYVAKGAEVWIPGQAKTAKHKNSLSAAQRTKIMADDNFLCRTCGIGSGEPYEDDKDVLSHLNVARREVVLPGGAIEFQMVTECKRCGSAGTKQVDLAAFLGQVEGLSALEQQVFASWIAADQRTRGAMEKLWGIFRTLPVASREAVRQAVAGDNK